MINKTTSDSDSINVLTTPVAADAKRRGGRSTPPAPRKGWRRRYTVAVVGLIILIALGLYGFFTVQGVRRHVTDGATHLQTAVDTLKGDNVRLDKVLIGRVRQELVAAQTDFGAARDGLGPFGIALPLLGWLPKVGYDVANLPSLLEIARQGSEAGTLVLDGVQPALTALEPGNQQTPSETNNKALIAADALSSLTAQQKFQQADQLVAEITARRTSLDPTRLGIEQARRAMDQLDAQLPTLRDGLKLARELPAILPQALGKTTPANYLVLVQNSDELRPTGGFISAVGVLGLNAGKMSVSNFQDSYMVDANPKAALPPPLEPMARYMGAAYLVLRDANWWPDFPTSARQLIQMYGQNQPTQPDGAVALDITAVSYIFEALGPLDIPEYNEHLTAQNFEERLHYYYLPPGTDKGDNWWLKRKEFVGVAMKALVGRLSSGSAGDYLRLVNQMSRAVTQKHLQFYFNAPTLERQLTSRQLDSAQTQPATSDPGLLNDYLMVTEANIGFNKVNPKIDRSLSYNVVSPGSGANLFASLTITYTSRAGVREGTEAGQCVKVTKYDSSYDAMANGCYWNYLRVYTPAGSRLRNSTGFMADSPLVPGTENNKTVFASQVVVPPGGSLTLTIDYVLPYQLSPTKNYRLTMQKQAGLPATPLSVRLDLAGQVHSWQTNLDTDSLFDPHLP